jgi:hypothetical protein
MGLRRVAGLQSLIGDVARERIPSPTATRSTGPFVAPRQIAVARGSLSADIDHRTADGAPELQHLVNA